MKFLIAQCNPTIGALSANASKIIDAIAAAKKQKCDLVIFSEMILCGYIPDDLLYEPGFIAACDKELQEIAKRTDGITAIVGTVRKNEEAGKPFKNAAAVLQNERLIGFQDKCLLPTYDIFDEARYMEPALSEKIWDIAGKKVGITICEDIWGSILYKIDPLLSFEGKNIDLLINLSASPYSLGKIAKRRELAQTLSKRLTCPVVIVNQIGAQDGVIYDGSSVYVDQNRVLIQAPSFKESQHVSTEEVAPPVMSEGQELFQALVLGVKDYFAKQGLTRACVGLSGGIDSAVVASIAKKALGSDNVLAVLLPSRFTLNQSQDDAMLLAQNLGIKTVQYSIEEPFQAFLSLLSSESIGLVEENVQSRIRQTLLMALSNRLGYLVLNTANKSETAMGYTTLYGDSCGAISVLGDLLKRQVYAVAAYINQVSEVIPKRIIERAPSAELRQNQKDTDTLPEYPILDSIVEAYVVHAIAPDEIAKNHGFDLNLVRKVCKTIHLNEFKRRQLPFSLRVSEKAFSCGRRIPIVQKFV